jgi:hypothetical protein
MTASSSNAPDLNRAHTVLQGLKSNPAALAKFHDALSSLSRETGVAIDDPTLTYVAQTLVNQRQILSNSHIGAVRGTETVSGFFIKPAI